jgi:hypothetical protein
MAAAESGSAGRLMEIDVLIGCEQTGVKDMARQHAFEGIQGASAALRPHSAVDG